MSTMNDLTKSLEALVKTVNENGAETRALKERVERAAQPVYPAGATPSEVFGVPSVRKGENVMGSRGFSFLKLFGVQRGLIPAEQAKIEMQVHEKLADAMCRKALGTDMEYRWFNGTKDGPSWGADGPVRMGQASTPSFLAPFGTDYLPEQVVDSQLAQEVKSLTYAGVEKADPEEVAWIRWKNYQAPQQKTYQSYLNEQLGGSLVPPPQMGELIQLFRNKEALVNAGACTIPLPPQGRIVFPTQLTATTGSQLGENAQINASNFGTGQLTLSAKKVAVLVQIPNELIRYGGPAAEALAREDMTKTLVLTADFQLLQGTGSDTSPRGLINTTGIAPISANIPGVNGDTFKAADLLQFPSAIEENNASMESWIMRPKSFYQLLQIQSGTGAGAGTGLFMFTPGRDMASGFKTVIAGMPAVNTPQISNARTKGTATNLTYILGGMFSDYLMGLFGAIEFAATTQGDTAFQYDQTWVRAILSYDGGPRHPGSFAFCDNIAAFSA